MSSGFANAESVFSKTHLYRSIAFMCLAAVAASAGVISYFNRAPVGFAEVDPNSFQLVASTLMPYMISAVIAAITAIGVVTILPTARLEGPANRLATGLREVADGDLTTRVRLESDEPLSELASELNRAVGHLNTQISEWKLLNRQQWGVLCRIRSAVEHGDSQRALYHVAEMEVNWDRIAEIESKLIA